MTLNGRIYAATSENVLANHLIERIQEIDEMFEYYKDTLSESERTALEEQRARDMLVLTYLPVLD
ncbi:protein of unknown function [Shewanella benthica]|uniref:Uncharacterized protein n=1 Tax=Shewanella benthica TaxID=43661 RepID=A0A330MBR7_9GAMM|nr:hypothetical protein [Shewanella benthica]SQH78460.1 protein of unknown function [Shewanella benthica]